MAECIGVLVTACPIFTSKNANNLTFSSEEALKELRWWHSQILIARNKIRISIFDLEIFSDASSTDWGITCGGEKVRGSRSNAEGKVYINFLEMKAAFLALKCFATSVFNKQILLRIDNVTIQAYLNKMERIKYRDLKKITKEVWE